MRVLVCGDRNWTDREQIRTALINLVGNCQKQRKDPPVIIHGAARGADTIAGEEASRLGLKVVAYPADWQKYGKAAGVIRNARMLNEGHPDLVMAFHGDIRQSKGTADMIAQAHKQKIPVILSKQG